MNESARSGVGGGNDVTARMRVSVLVGESSDDKTTVKDMSVEVIARCLNKAVGVRVNAQPACG